jgi:hypothetical protein
VYMLLQPGGGTGTGEPVVAIQPPPRAQRTPATPAVAVPPAAPPPPKPPPIPALELPPTPVPEAAPAAPAPEIREADRRYTVQSVGFEGDTFDRRAIRILIRTKALNESDKIRVGDAEPVRADELPDLKSLFELRKNARFTPPAVCRKHTDQLAHYVCAATGRPLCENCAAEKKYGGTAVRSCEHCAGNVNEMPVEPA